MKTEEPKKGEQKEKKPELNMKRTEKKRKKREPVSRVDTKVESKVPGRDWSSIRPEHRYESDMSFKERRAYEWEKLKAMTWGERFDYIWAYYKALLAGIAGVILVIILGVQWVQNLKNEDILYVTVVDSTMADTAKLEAELKTWLEDDVDYHFVTFDTSVFFSGEDDYTTTMKMMAYIAAGTMDILISSEDTYTTYVEQEAYLDLKEILGEDLYAKVEEDVTEDGFAIQIQDNEKWQETGLTVYEPVYLTVMSTTQNQENAVKFIEWLYEE